MSQAKVKVRCQWKKFDCIGNPSGRTIKLCQTNSTIGESMQELQLFFNKIYIAVLVWFLSFCHSILTNKIHCTNHEMQATKIKKNKNERRICRGGLNLASLICTLSINYRWFWFRGSITTLYWPRLWRNIFLYIGRSCENFDNWKCKALVCKKELQL